MVTLVINHIGISCFVKLLLIPGKIREHLFSNTYISDSNELL